MVINLILDLDPSDNVIKEVSKLASSFGLSDMLEVVMQLASFEPGKAGQLLFLITDENAAEAIATLLALAIINYATWNHEEVFISHHLPAEPPLRFYRNQAAEGYKTDGDNYFTQAKKLAEKYFPEC